MQVSSKCDSVNVSVLIHTRHWRASIHFRYSLRGKVQYGPKTWMFCLVYFIRCNGCM